MTFLIFVYGNKYGKYFRLTKDKNNNCRILLPKEDFALYTTICLELKNISKAWYIRENKNCKIQNRHFLQLEKQLVNNEFYYRLNSGRTYDLQIGTQKLCLQLACKKNFWNMYDKYKLKDCKIINDKNNIAILPESSTTKEGINILYRNGRWEIENYSKEKVYINELFVEGCKILTYGDLILFSGVLLLFLEQYIAVERIENFVDRNEEIIYLDKVMAQNIGRMTNKTLSLKAQAFHRAPRIMEEIQEISLKFEAPPVIDIKEKTSIFMDIGPIINMMLPMLGMNLFLIYAMKSEQNHMGLYVYSGILMAVISAISSILWILISRKYVEKEREKWIHKQRKSYRRYLNKKNAIIKKQYERVNRVLRSRYVRADQYIHSTCGYTYLWNRNPYHEDFLIYRIGIGDMKFPMKIELPEEVIGCEEDILWQEAKSIKENYAMLYQVPMLLNIKKYNQIGIIGSVQEKLMGIIRSMILQIAICNCYTEVRVGCVYNEDEIIQSEQWDFFRWLPHIWDENREKRFIAGNQTEARHLFYELFQIFKEREECGFGNNVEAKLPHYVLFIAEGHYLEGEMFSKYIFDENINKGLTVIWITRGKEMLPNTCKVILQDNKEFSGWYEVERHSQKKEKVNFDYTQKKVTDRLLRDISGIRVAKIEEKKGIPQSIDFLSMYEVDTVEDLRIDERWKNNKIYESARVVIGKKSGGECCYLDIHENYHGPHGLLAGTTGSGKSEVLQTFILSMAINFSPEEVNFLLIDYKGEGMSGVFSDLPHLSGKISNLSDGQVYRAMISIKSENRRRQKIFRDYNVNNINDYTKLFFAGRVEQAIPHLLIIIDEFAELKKEEPEFMQELISVAQVGRSLGVHLILATQKPGGTVDDKIWSNSRFRICLKVQEREDSLDMIHNTDACEIVQTGRGYLQVGNNEVYELFQAGWSGAIFQGDNKKTLVQAVMRDGTLISIKERSEETEKKKRVGENEGRGNDKLDTEPYLQLTQLQVVKRYIIDYANKEKYQKGKKLWLEPLPNYLYLEDLKKIKEKQPIHDFKQRGMKIPIGLFDDPENQEQPIFVLNLVESGHIGICGRSTSGKSTFLQTFIYSVIQNNPKEAVDLYLLDFNGGGMDIYDSAIQVRQVIKEEEIEQLEIAFNNITKEMKYRKKKFAGGNFIQYSNREKEDSEKFPLIFIVLDGFMEFCEMTYQRYEDFLYSILREGEKLGVIIVISVESFSSMHISMRLSELFKTKICLYMKDSYAYAEAFDIIRSPILPKKGVAGRGVAYYQERILEFQTALVVRAENDYVRQEIIKRKLCEEG